MQHFIDIPCSHPRIRHGSQAFNAAFQQPLQPCADDIEGQPEYQCHNANKGRDCRIFAGEELVNFPAAFPFLAFPCLDYASVYQLSNKRKPHVGNGCCPVQTAFLLHLADNMLHHLLFIFSELEDIHDALVTFHQLGCGKTNRNFRLFRMVLNQMHNAVQTAVYRTSMVAFITEILSARSFLIFGHMHRMVDQFFDAFILRRGNRHHRNAQQFLHGIDVNTAAVAAHLIHHIEYQHHGHIQLHQLHGQIQISFNIRGIHDVDNALWLFVDDKLPGNNFLTGIGRQGINARQVGNQRIRSAANRAAFSVHRHTGKIAHMLVGACQLIEQGGLAAVLVAGKSKGQLCSLRQRIFIRLYMVNAAFTKARMFCVFPKAFRCCFGLFPGFYRMYRNFFRISQPQGQLIAMNAQLHGIAHGGKLLQRYLCTGNHTHVQKMLTECTFTAHHINHGSLANFQIL